MKFHFGLALAMCAGMLCAQTNQPPLEDTAVAQARAGLDKLRALVDAGAAPRAQLERAEAALADAEDAAILRRTLYGSDLTEEQSDEMLAAARRRLDRRKEQLERAKQMVAQGVAGQLSLGTFLEEVDMATKEYDLAASRANLARELTVMARNEAALQKNLEEAPAEAHKIAERFDGNGVFTPFELRQVETAFEQHFNKPLPVSALGETAVHRALGFDHRGRVDVAVHPDQPEGIWLRHYLAAKEIPYFAFRQAVPGKATGAHIHIGPGSTRLVRGG